ncbi:MAG: TonB-dependent receptor [Verrucomicrobia bacterium]|nr:TonB-dependent receptor [Verrucomicrobiota bacterium]
MNNNPTMTHRIVSITRACLALLGAAWLACTTLAQSSTTGTIEGRVSHPASGNYLETARLTVDGTTLESFSDSDGNYRLTNVPAGSAKVKVFCTGFLPQTTAVGVTAGQVVRHDIQLDSFQRSTGAPGGVVKLDEFVVAASREMAAAAYAINEQRFAPNLKSVVSTDEFGSVAEGNIGEFLKFLPGISIDYNSGFALNASINGVPPQNVPITLDGFSVAGSGVFGGYDMTSRAVSLTNLSINNLSRIEVEFSPTAESKGSALAGSINMVPRSSFERSRPVFNYSVYALMRDDTLTLRKTAGPTRDGTYKIHPGFDFSYIVPVNKRFGFTLSGGTSKQYSGEPNSGTQWRGAGVPTNGTTFPHTTPDKPYLTRYRFRGGGRDTMRNSLGATVDYRLTPNDRISFSIQYNYNDQYSAIHDLLFNVNQVLPGNFTTTSTRGAVGAGSYDAIGFARNLKTRVYMPTMRWRHDGPVWKAEAGAGLSHSSFKDRDVDKGFLQTNTARRTGVTISFDDIFYLRPRVITVTDGATGQPVDPYSHNSMTLVSGVSAQTDFTDGQRTAYANLRRDFFGRVPFTLKGGLDLQQSMRDVRGGIHTYNFVGPDGRASTTPVGNDDGAAPFVNVSYLNESVRFGFPSMPRLSPYLIYEAYRDHPTWFTTNASTSHISDVTRSKHTKELVSSAYLRGDVSFFDRRLKLVGGVRAEQTNVKAEGPLTDPTRNIQYDARGVALRGPTGQPLPVTTNALEATKLTSIDRGGKADKEYLRLFPSINASYGLKENLIARASYYHSIGRPSINQYAGGVTLPNLENLPSSSNRITVNNAGIKAWSAQSTQVRLEYYFEGVGEVSVGAFRRDFENFFGGVVTRPTPEFLALYGLDPDDYGTYDVSTQQNLEDPVRMTGVTVNYKQALTFLPRWARGVQVFANGSAQRATGAATDNFAGYVPRTASWGVSLSRERFNFRLNWNYKGRNRRGLVAAGNSIEPGTYNWGSKYLFLDVLGEYHFLKHLSFFFNLRNVGNSYTDFEIAGPSTPPHAQFNSRVDYGSLWTFGVKGTF